jgi:hypothetical protein
MTYQVDINQLLEIASELLPYAEFNGYRQTAEDLAHNLAIRVAELADNTEYCGTSTLQVGFGGLCSPFIASCKDEPIDSLILTADPGGA